MNGTFIQTHQMHQQVEVLRHCFGAGQQFEGHHWSFTRIIANLACRCLIYQGRKKVMDIVGIHLPTRDTLNMRNDWQFLIPGSNKFMGPFTFTFRNIESSFSWQCLV